MTKLSNYFLKVISDNLSSLRKNGIVMSNRQIMSNIAVLKNRNTFNSFVSFNYSKTWTSIVMHFSHVIFVIKFWKTIFPNSNVCIHSFIQLSICVGLHSVAVPGCTTILLNRILTFDQVSSFVQTLLPPLFCKYLYIITLLSLLKLFMRVPPKFRLCCTIILCFCVFVVIAVLST